MMGVAFAIYKYFDIAKPTSSGRTTESRLTI